MVRRFDEFIYLIQPGICLSFLEGARGVSRHLDKLPRANVEPYKGKA
jgi:hypothetical protein